jgi:hypothetical protein
MKNLRILNLCAFLGTFFLALTVPTYGSFFWNFFDKPKPKEEYKLACNAHTDNPDVSCLDKRFKEMAKEVFAQPSVQVYFRESYFPSRPEIDFYYDPQNQDPFFTGTTTYSVIGILTADQSKFFVGQGSGFLDHVKGSKLSQHQADAGTCVAILHELGHIVNKDLCKEYIYRRKNDQSFIQSPGVQNFLKDHSEFKELLLEKNLSDSLPLSYSRNAERRADDFGIKHTTNPFALLFEANNFKYYNERYSYDGSGTHPSFAERAEKFQDAAQKLMLKQMLEGGRSLGRKDKMGISSYFYYFFKVIKNSVFP